MAMQKALLLGLGAMIFGGCDNGVEDAGGGSSSVGDRWGRACYSTTNDKASTTLSVDKGSDASSQADGFTLTMKAGAASSPQQAQSMFDDMRREAGLTAQHHLGQSCWEMENIAQNCMQTCEERGLVWNEEVVVCDDCRLLDDGTLDCGPEIPESLQLALSEPWHGDHPWFYVDQDAQLQLVMYPPELREDWNGELVWSALVEVTGFCLCACTG